MTHKPIYLQRICINRTQKAENLKDQVVTVIDLPQVPCPFSSFGCTNTTERRTMPAHVQICPFAPYAEGLSAAMEDLAVLRRLTAAGLSEAIAAATSGINGTDAVGPGGIGSGLLPYPPAVIAEARNRLGKDHEWKELSKTQRLTACKRDPSQHEEKDHANQNLGKFERDIGSVQKVHFSDQNSFQQVDRLSISSPLTRTLEMESDPVAGVEGTSHKGTRAGGITFVVTAALPAPKRPGRDNKASLTPVAEARGQLPATIPFLASVGPDEGSLCLW